MASKTSKTSKTSKVTSIKGFDRNLRCRGFQFELGKTYSVSGKIEACENGFHACPVDEHPLSVFEFYPPAGSRFAEVTQSGKQDRKGIKLASAKVTIGVELTLSDLVERAVKWVFDRADWQNADKAIGPNQGAAASGDRGVATASGYQGVAMASGTQGVAMASGTRDVATASGYQGVATASGYQGVAAAYGTEGAAMASGYQGAAMASGYRGTATASGNQGVAMASGTQGAAMASGRFCGAYASGHSGKVSGVAGSSLHLDERIWAPGTKRHGKIVAVWAGIVGRDGIKPNTFYTLKNGKPIEVES